MLVPFIFMLMCSASFVCDMYFFIKHGGLKGSESNSVAIILVHLLIVSPYSYMCIICMNGNTLCVNASEIMSWQGKGVSQAKVEMIGKKSFVAYY